MQQVKLPKHKYVMPLDDAMREQIAPLAQPYPKREDPSVRPIEGPELPAQAGGAGPTRTLQEVEAEAVT